MNSTGWHTFHPVTDQFTDRRFRDKHPPPLRDEDALVFGPLRVQS